MVDFLSLSNLILILASALIGGVIASTLRLPPIIGFLLGGIIFGPNGLGLVKNTQELSSLSEIGIALLMFTLGVEFSLKKLYGVGRVAVVGTAVQIIASILSGIIFTAVFKLGLAQGLFLGALLSFSSTAVVVKILTDKNLIDTVPGELSTGWLLVQDLAVLPVMLLIPTLAGSEISLVSIFLKIAQSVVVLGAVIYLGIHLIPKLLLKTALWGRELLFLLVVILVLAISLLSNWLGLSFAIGAFLAGLIIASSPISQEALAQIRSFRNLFLVIFFVTLGMMFKPEFLLFNVVGVAFILLVHHLVKFISTFSWISSFGYHPKPSFISSLWILQIGEFSFVLAALGLKDGLLSANSYNLFLSSALLSLLLTPMMIGRSEAIYKIFKKFTLKLMPSFYNRELKIVGEEPNLVDHVIVCGYGRVGKYVSDALKHVEIPQVVIDYNPENLKAAQEKGLKVIYGDSADLEVLASAQVAKAKALVITHPDQTSSIFTIYKAKELNKDIKILARAHRDEDVENLRYTGIHRVIQPEFEASLTFSEKLLDLIGVDKEKIDSFVKHIRRRIPS